jgi:hypothetical protein
MRVTAVVGAAMLVFAGAHAAWAAEITSGIAVDGKIGAYSCTKCGGAEDGVEIGKSLCYT